MRILLLTLESFDRVKAGVEIFSLHLKKAFRDLTIIDAKKVGVKEASKLDAPLKDVLKAKAICDYVNKNYEKLKPDVIFVNGLCGWALSKKIKAPVVCVLHGGYEAYANAAMKFGLDYLRNRYIYAYFEALSAKRADFRIANSEFTRKNLKNYCDIESDVIYNGIDTSIFKPLAKAAARKKIGLDKSNKIVLFVGRADYAKGHDILESLAVRNKGLKFIAILYPKIESKIANLKTVGPLTVKELRNYYCAADVVVNPSRFEGFGYVPLEALSCNVPVVAHNTGVIKEIEVKGLEKVNKLSVELFEKKLRKALGEKINSHKFVEKKFPYKKFVENYKKFVEKSMNYL